MKPRMRPDHPWLRSGPDHPAAKLSAEARIAIRNRAEAGEAPKRLAWAFGVSITTVRRLRRGSGPT